MKNRFTKSNPCPICGGHSRMPVGKGIRCWGFRFADDSAVVCTREEYAGTAQYNPKVSGYIHRSERSLEARVSGIMNRSRKRSETGERRRREWRETDLQKFRAGVPRYMLNRGFSIETCKAWGVGCSVAAPRYDVESGGRTAYDAVRAVIPVRDGAGKLVGLVGRATEDWMIPKWWTYYGTARERCLFGVDKVEFGATDWPARVILVEGPFDVINLYQLGMRNSVAVLGNTVSEEQVRMLREMDRGIGMLFDSDSGGRQARETVKRYFIGSLPLWDMRPEHGGAGDPGELSIEGLREVLRRAKRVYAPEERGFTRRGKTRPTGQQERKVNHGQE